MRRPKVFFFIPSFAGGGAERQCIYLVNKLAQSKSIDIGLVYFHEGVNFHLVDSSLVALFPVVTSSNYNPMNAWVINRLFIAEQPDIVFSWLHASDVFTWAARFLGAKFKWVMAERDSWYPPDFRYWIRSLVGRHADIIVANSHKGSVYWAERGVLPTHQKVIGNILLDEWFLPRVIMPDNGSVCFAGRFEPQKNIPLLLDAFIELSKYRVDTKFNLIGEGSLKPYIEQKINLAREGAISVLGFQSNIRPLFEKTSVFVNVSYHEGRPNTVIENMVLGNRLVLSNIPEHIELVGEQYPFLVDLNISASDLAIVIERALNAPVLSEEKLRFHDKLSSMRVETIAHQYMQLFLSIIGKENEKD